MLVFALINLLGTIQGAFVHGEKSQCEMIAAKVAMENQNTIVDTNMKRLTGTWLSEGCEIRPGPEYLLRSYSFKADGSYKLIQHRYWDDSCSNPKFTLVTHGEIKIKRDSFLNLDSANGFFKHFNVSVIPQDLNAVNELEQLVSNECPDQTWKSWRRYEEHVIYESDTSNNRRISQFVNSASTLNTQKQLPQISGDLSCMGSLKWAFKELKLLKIQLRPILNENLENTYGMKYELLLGDIHSRSEQREQYTPTSFQIPLLKYIKNEEDTMRINDKVYQIKNNCNICSNLYSSDKSPPHLIEKPHLPPYVWGEWVSIRCENRPMGLYLTRKFTFHPDDSIWIGEHKFYKDPFCTVPKFVVTAAGHFVLTGTSGIIDGSTNVDFKIERASLTLFNRGMVHEMRMFNSCGAQNWEIGIPQELTSTKGCMQLGILIPSIQYELIKIEMNYEGSCLLFLGQADTNNLPRLSNDRPTSFQVPLIKCGDASRYSEGLGQILGGDLDYDYYNNSNANLSFKGIIFLMFFVLFI